MAAAALAALLVGLAQIAGWHGVDTAAQTYRVEAFRQHGFTLWDPGWYGGHWTLDYSVLYPPLAGTVGQATVAVLSAAAAALAFDRLARAPLGPGGRPAALVFAAGTLVPAAIGQLTFLAGAAFGLVALWAARAATTDDGHPTGAPAAPRLSGRAAAAVAALACALTSPLTGAFLALALVAWAVGTPRSRRVAVTAGGLAVLAVGPVLAGVALFPGDGPMPYPVTDWIWEMVVAAALAGAAARHRPIRAGALIWMVAATASVLVPSSLGGNVGRIEDLVALPLAAGLLWTRLPLLLPVAAVPLALSQWSPAWGALTSAAAQPSTHEAFYAPLDQELARRAAAGPAGRVEVIPTEYHWESVYVAPVMPLARGWERQLDVADDPLFYRAGGLTPQSYRAWLLADGVRFVAVPAAPLDPAGRAEAALVASGRAPGLALVWQDPDWALYSVAGSPGLVSGPARLVAAQGSTVVVDTSGPGTVTIRVRYSPRWGIASGAGCLTRSQPAWLALRVPGPERVRLGLGLLSAPGGRTSAWRCGPSTPS